MGTIRLIHPEYAGLTFGPDRDEAIRFGARGGNPDYVAVVDENHPLLPALLAAHPEITVATEAGPTEVYPCPFGCGVEDFKTRRGIREHLEAVHLVAGADAGATETPAATASAPKRRSTPRRASRARKARPAAKAAPAAPPADPPAAPSDDE